LKILENNVGSISTAKNGRFINWAEKTVLIVEDDKSNHAYFEEVLSTTTAKIVHAWDGGEAVEYIKKHADVSLVLMDIKMPVMDGYEATRLIKQIRPKLPVIAQTAFTLGYSREQSLKAGFDDYMSKPIPKDALVELIAGYLV